MQVRRSSRPPLLFPARETLPWFPVAKHALPVLQGAIGCHGSLGVWGFKRQGVASNLSMQAYKLCKPAACKKPEKGKQPRSQ